MTQTKKIIIFIVVLVILGVGVFVSGNLNKVRNILNNNFISQETGKNQELVSPAAENKKEQAELLPTVEGGTRAVVKEEIKTPEPSDTATGTILEDIAIPKTSVHLGAEQSTAALRIFDIKAEGGEYSPSTFVVNELDVIQFDFTAVDAPYNIFFPDFGVYKKAAKGETVKIQFQAYPFGEYKFFCRDCKEDITGKLIVNKKQ